MAVLGVCLNGVASFCCLGAIGLVVLWRSWRRWQAWTFLLFTGLLFLGVLLATGFISDAGAPGNPKAPVTAAQVRRLAQAGVTGFFLLLGLRPLALLNLAWGTTRTKVTMLSFVGIFTMLNLAVGFENYPFVILNLLLGGYAAAPMAKLIAGLRAGDSLWGDLWNDLTTCYRRYLGVLFLYAVLIWPGTFYPVLRHRSFDHLYAYSTTLFGVLVASLLCYLVLRQINRRQWVPRRKTAAWVLVSLLLLSSLGVVRACANHGWNLLGETVLLDAGRVASLRFLRENVDKDALLATTHHSLPLRSRKERSYVYCALAERYVLLEGWVFGRPSALPCFEQTHRDNAALFVTEDQAEARAIAQKYAITHILVEPGEQLGLDVDRVPWLQRVPNPGSLDILSVKLSARE